MIFFLWCLRVLPDQKWLQTLQPCFHTKYQKDDEFISNELASTTYFHSQITGEDNKSKGFGFVSYEDSTHAEAACNDLDGKEIEGKPIYVGRAQKKAERTAELKKKFDALKMERMTRYQGIYFFNLPCFYLLPLL